MNKVIKIVFDDDASLSAIKSFIISIQFILQREALVAQTQIYEEDFESEFEFEEEGDAENIK